MSVRRLYKAERVAFLTDGIFAIAMTILVLDIHPPVLPGRVTDQQLWNALQPLVPELITFALAFYLLAAAWGVHLRQFEGLEEVDFRYIWLNTIRLFFVALIPFTVSFSNDYSETAMAVMLFILNFMLISVVSYFQWWYANRPGGFNSHKQSPETVRYGHRRNRISIAASLIALCVAAFWPRIGIMLYACTPLILLTVSKVDGRITLLNKKI